MSADAVDEYAADDCEGGFKDVPVYSGDHRPRLILSRSLVAELMRTGSDVVFELSEDGEWTRTLTSATVPDGVRSIREAHKWRVGSKEYQDEVAAAQEWKAGDNDFAKPIKNRPDVSARCAHEQRLVYEYSDVFTVASH